MSIVENSDATGGDRVDARVTSGTAGDQDLELRQSEALLRALTDNSPDAIYVKDRDSRWLMANPAVLRLVGRTAEQALGKTDQELYGDPVCRYLGIDPARFTGTAAEFFAAVHPDDHEGLKVALELTATTGAPYEVEYRAIWPDGSQHDIIARGQLARDAAGQPKWIDGLVWDITEGKRTEEALRESEARQKVTEAVQAEQQRFRQALDQLPAYLVLLSPDYHVPFANRFFEERFGKSNGKRCYEYLFNRSEPCENCESYKVLKTGQPHHWEWTGPDGRNYDIHDFPFTDVDGSPLIMEVGIDITAVKQAEAALKAERQRLYDVLETLPAMICLLTKDHHVAFANRGFREKFGEANGRRCYECCFGRTEPCDFCQSYSVFETGKPHHWEVKAPDGSVIDAYDFPFTDADGTPMILEMDLDITERRQAEAELAKHREHLEELVQQRTAELRATNSELTRFNRAMVGRELRMIELKQEVNELCGKLGQAPRYPLQVEPEPQKALTVL